MKNDKLITAIAMMFAVALMLAGPANAASSHNRRSKNVEVAQASETKSDKPADESKAQDEEAEEPEPAAGADPAGGMAPTDAFGSDVNIEKMNFDKLTYDANGDLLLTGRVDIQSDKFNIKGAVVNYVKDKETLYAKGSPVHIEVHETNPIKATGRTATYNVKTKQMVLEGDPVVNQFTSTKRVEIRGDIIRYTTGKNGGRGSLSVEMKPGSTRQPEYKEFPTKKASQKKNGEKAKPIGNNNTDLLKIPQTESGS